MKRERERERERERAKRTERWAVEKEGQKKGYVLDSGRSVAERTDR